MLLTIISSFVFFVISIIFPIGGIIFLIKIFSPGKFLFELNSRLLMRVYAYTVSFVALGLMVIGLFLFTKASLSYVFGYQFSYEVKPYITNASQDRFSLPNIDEPPIVDSKKIFLIEGEEKIKIKGKDYFVNTAEIKMDFLGGLLVFFISGVVFLLHRLGLNYLYTNNKISLLEIVYLYGNLIVTSLISLIFFSIATYGILENIILDVPLQSYSRFIPGGYLAITLVVTPMWIYFLIRALMLRKNFPLQKYFFKMGK